MGTGCKLGPEKLLHPTLPAWFCLVSAAKCRICLQSLIEMFQWPKIPGWTGAGCALGWLWCVLSLAPTWVVNHGINPLIYFWGSGTCWEATLCSHWTDQHALWKHAPCGVHGSPNPPIEQDKPCLYFKFSVQVVLSQLSFIACHTNHSKYLLNYLLRFFIN